MARISQFLAGIRVLDLTRHIPGPLATLLMADMGAEILKIEPPGGDEMRTLGPKDKEGRSIYFEALNDGKSTRRMDLKDAAQRAEFLELVKAHDVLIESFRPDVMGRLGLGYDTLKAVNPGLVYCSMNGYGYGGPLAKSAGHDNNYLALAGILHRNGEGKPAFFDPPISDSAGSLMAIIAILGALNARARDGKGCEIDLALADAAMPLQAYQLAALGRAGIVPQPADYYLNGGAAYYQIYPTADGYHLALGAVEAKFWEAFCRGAERPDWIERQNDPMPQSSLKAELAAYFGALTLDEAMARFWPEDCCLTPVLDLALAAESPHFRERGLLPRGPSGDYQALFPALVDGEPPKARAPLVELDE
ncbi:MAG TPA: CoA transferase [Alphaproteobacteria bacterium]|nr:CoA transferase [Alphaproteobacteria bacterium]